jgi:hypothetical protein
MSAIGGYFELELSNRGEYYPDAIDLNSARNALEYIIRAKKIQRLFIPYYICNTVLELLDKLGATYIFYNIDKYLDPLFDLKLKSRDAFLYVNYFGVKQKTVKLLTGKYKNLIIDNAQAFYCRPLPGVDTFYSTRKFFGVPDGAYLYTDKFLEIKLDRDISMDRIGHLLKRIEYGPEYGYKDFLQNENFLSGQPIKRMSYLTRAILRNINYSNVKRRREKNFLFLHKHIGNINELKIDIDNIVGPMVYPLLIEKKGLKESLIKDKIFLATYWKNVFDLVSEKDFEFNLVKYLIPLPVDQRYEKRDLIKIVEKIMCVL